MPTFSKALTLFLMGDIDPTELQISVTTKPVFRSVCNFFTFPINLLISWEKKCRTVDVVRSVCKIWVHLYFKGHHFLFTFCLFFFPFISCLPFFRLVMYYSSPIQTPILWWFSPLCLKISSFLHTCACTMPHTFIYDGKKISGWDSWYSGLGSVVLWLSRGGVNPEGHLPSKVVFQWNSSSAPELPPATHKVNA